MTAEESLTAYLIDLERDDLEALLQAQPGIRAGTLPTSHRQLAVQLCDRDSWVEPLRELDLDGVRVSQAVAILGVEATVPGIAKLLGAGKEQVHTALAALRRIGLAWPVGDQIVQADSLNAHWQSGIGDLRPAAKVGRQALLDQLQSAVEALGMDSFGKKKMALIGAWSAAVSDPRRVEPRIAALSDQARHRLERMRREGEPKFPYYSHRAHEAEHLELARQGLVVKLTHHWEAPQEVAVALWMFTERPQLSGQPEIQPATCDPASPASTAAAYELLRATTSLLDEAQARPIRALKNGGIGKKEQTRLAATLGLDKPMLILGLDLAYAADLLAELDDAYVAADEYEDWRASSPEIRWARLVATWFELMHAPSLRVSSKEKEHPPPLPMGSAAGMIRRGLFRAAANGRSLAAAGRVVEWYVPLHGYPERQRDERVVAAIMEAAKLGLVAGDALTEYGEQLAATAKSGTDDLAADFAKLVTLDHDDGGGRVTIQADLTAIVEGQPSVRLAKLLAATADSEARGAASIWRFTPASIRRAMDEGWTADELLAELGELSERALPQTLEYLIGDEARRHGNIRVRTVRTCVVAEEALTSEILTTRGLSKLKLTQLAPTVLASPEEPERVLTTLRAAGLSPIVEEADGTLVVERSPSEIRDDGRTRPKVYQSRLEPERVSAATLADGLINDTVSQSLLPGPDDYLAWLRS